MIDGLASRLEGEANRHWLRWTLLAWAVVAVFWLTTRWGAVHWLGLGDTDDNMRLMQVRGLLAGQGWYDLTQYRMNPPQGFNIHWSRIVDLPIAGLILLFKPFVGTAWAERLACGIAPILPLAVTMGGFAFVVRRLVAPLAYILTLIILLGAGGAMLMFMPMRIDHHGWQLACLSLTVAGLADARQVRGGVLVGLATAVSLNIGLEMLPYGAMAGAIITLRWVLDRAEARRLTAYALSLGGASAGGFAIFASNANQAMRCDALTPVWLTVLVLAGAKLFVMARVNPASRGVRLGMAVVAGAIIAVGFAWLFPQCLGRPEGVSPELQRTWLNNVREAKPIYSHPLRNALPIAALPIAGLIGAIIAAWRARREAIFAAWLPVALFTAFAVLMLLWQVRAGPAAQLLAVPGATALAWIVVPWCLGHRLMLVRVLGSVAAFLVISGMFAGLVLKWLPIDRPDKRAQIVNRANGRCPTIPAMAPLNRLRPSVIFTHVDLGPRLITLTHHYAVAGPYHRNGDAILDVHHAFTGSADQFRDIARAHGARLLLICPNMAESTVYRARSPNGFYAQLAKGKVPAWLVRVPLPKGSPLRLWRIDYAAAERSAR
ncbi:AcrB/AcrD/AcrF family protein [Sphingomonas donggukensis]|uniref:AcrB/AcrD/AcrF family protein n=1 Tax=Sphingomonas donggukensis TaxID=2949093 RepID=A0ABY4TUT3_9SPHN|nr:AcrB/AcrD/AcrF family protein [Sphingomonas donggukensis]URW74929.1 AcrB/AcrD/AcrF family protein [Sphingomonas donggukensis]